MFEIVEKKGQTYINLTRGDSAEIETIPFIDTNENKTLDESSDDRRIILGDDDYVLFCIASPSGRIYFKKAINKNDYNNNGILTVKLSPADTVDLQPYSYMFSFSYMPHKGEDCYTYAVGIFNILPAVGTVKDLNECFTSVESEDPANTEESGNIGNSAEINNPESGEADGG